MRVYFSLPVALGNREAIYKNIESKLKATDPNTVTLLWTPQLHYDTHFVTSCNIFIFKGIDNRWNFKFHELPSGVQKELNLAINHNKQIFMIYTNSQGEDNLYEVTITDNFNEFTDITGVAGTSSTIYKLLLKHAPYRIPDQVKKVPKIPEDCFKKQDSSSFDARLLLG